MFEQAVTPICTSEAKLRVLERLSCSRAATLALFEGLDHATFCRQAHPDFSPVGWHLGHIGYTEAHWLLERCAGQPLPLPEYRRVFAVDSLPKALRSNLPDQEEVRYYLNTIRAQVLLYLEVAPLEHQERLWRWLIQHESQHSETVAIVLQLQSLTRFANLVMSDTSPVAQVNQYEQPTQGILIAAGSFEQGSDSIDALDNERPAHRVHLEPYLIDRYPVTRAQYRAFLLAGGYHERCWWSEEGWSWLGTQRIAQPLYWSITEDDRLPVCGVSAYEAEAYAQFANKRLPTEAEWEKAAGRIAIRQISRTSDQSRSGVVDIPATGYSNTLSNVWEWTSTWFHPYDGFVSYPYPGYSAPYFDRQHRVLKGGSWASQPWTSRSSFRTWYHPGTREIFAGFRCVQDKYVAGVESLL